MARGRLDDGQCLGSALKLLEGGLDSPSIDAIELAGALLGCPLDIVSKLLHRVIQASLQRFGVPVVRAFRVVLIPIVVVIPTLVVVIGICIVRQLRWVSSSGWRNLIDRTTFTSLVRMDVLEQA